MSYRKQRAETTVDPLEGQSKGFKKEKLVRLYKLQPSHDNFFIWVNRSKVQ